MAHRFADVSAGLEGRYTIEREFGRGAMATVSLAEDLRLRRRVAVKLLHAELAAALGRERFQYEISIASRLDRPQLAVSLRFGAPPS